MINEPPDSYSEVEEWVVLWFPPDRDREWKTNDEAKARRKAAKDGVAQWNPLLEHRITTTVVVSELVAL